MRKAMEELDRGDESYCSHYRNFQRPAPAVRKVPWMMERKNFQRPVPSVRKVPWMEPQRPVPAVHHVRTGNWMKEKQRPGG